MRGTTLLAVLAALVALIPVGCRRPAPPDIDVQVQGFRGLEDDGTGHRIPVFVTGEPAVFLVHGADATADLRIAAWITEPAVEGRTAHLLRHPGGDDALPVTRLHDDLLLTVVPTDDLPTGVPITVVVTAWEGDPRGLDEWIDGDNPPTEAHRSAAWMTHTLIVDAKDRRTRDASQPVVDCRAAYKQKAEDTGDRCRSAALGAPARDRMLALERLGFLARREGRLDDAAGRFEEAAAAAVEADLPAEETTYLRLAAHNRGEAGDYVAAHALATRALDIDLEHGHLAWQARDRANLGFFAARLGAGPDALDHLRRARDLARLLQRPGDEANALLALAAVHQSAGRYEQALASLEEARPLLAVSDDPAPHEFEAWSTFQTNLGWTLLMARRRGLTDADPAVIEAAFEEALAIHQQQDLPAWEANARMNLARLDLAEGRPDRAQERIDAAAADLAGTSSFEHGSYLTSLRGELALQRGDHADALAEYERLAEAEGEWAARWWADHGRARALASAGRSEDAIAAFERSLHSIEGDAALLDPLVDRPYFLGDRDEVFDAYVTLLVDLGRHDDAFAVAERGRLRSAHADRGVVLGGEDGVLERMAAVSSAQLQLQTHEEEEAFLLTHQRDAWQSRRAELVDDLVRAQSALVLGRNDNLSAASAEDLRAALPDGAVAAAYHTTRDEVLVFVVRDSEPTRVLRRPMGRVEVARLVRDHRAEIDAGGPALTPGSLDENLLPAELEIPLDSTLVVFPHGPLRDLPFCTLGREGGRLVEHVRIAMAPSAGAFVAARRPGPRGQGAVVLGDPTGDLRGARDEASAVADLLPGAALLTGSQATVAAFEDAATSAALLHFAGHGVIDAEIPPFSHLRLAGGGRVTWMDLQSLAAVTDLAVLSGCDTGKDAALSAGQGWSLAAGLLDAGSSAVVGAGWRVDDAASRELMVRMYKNGRTMPPAEALRQAQIALLRGDAGETSSVPRAWGAFVLFGWGSDVMVKN